VTKTLLDPVRVTHWDPKNLYAPGSKGDVRKGGRDLCVRGWTEDVALAGLNRKAKGGQERKKEGKGSSNTLRGSQQEGVVKVRDDQHVRKGLLKGCKS
jgi:hypothetical protein